MIFDGILLSLLLLPKPTQQATKERRKPRFVYRRLRFQIPSVSVIFWKIKKSNSHSRSHKHFPTTSSKTYSHTTTKKVFRIQIKKTHTHKMSTNHHKRQRGRGDVVRNRKTNALSSSSNPKKKIKNTNTKHEKERASFDSQIADHLTLQAESKLNLFAKELRSVLDEKTRFQNQRSKAVLRKLQGVFQDAWKHETRIRNEAKAASSQMKSGQFEAKRVVDELLVLSNGLLKQVNSEIRSVKSQVKKQIASIDEEIRARLESL